MKRIELDRAFTAKVSEYLNKGYIIHSETMGGSQGEIAKVDLVKGEELLRIWMNCESTYSHLEGWYGTMIVLRVSLWIHPVLKQGTRDTVWMSDLRHIKEIKYYQVNHWSDWYIESLEEARSICETRHERYYTKQRRNNTLIDITSPKTQEVARKYLISRVHYKRVATAGIQVIKEVNPDDYHRGYRIRYNGHNYYLR